MVNLCIMRTDHVSGIVELYPTPPMDISKLHKEINESSFLDLGGTVVSTKNIRSAFPLTNVQQSSGVRIYGSDAYAKLKQRMRKLYKQGHIPESELPYLIKFK